MAKLTTAEFIDAIKELSVLELNDLVKACEEEFLSLIHIQMCIRDSFISEKVLDIRTQVDNLLDFSIAGSQRPIELDASMDVEYIFCLLYTSSLSALW